MMKNNKYTPLVSTIVLLTIAVSTAFAWSPGPYSVERCAKEFDTCIKGQVVKEEVLYKEGEFELSRATVKISKVYKGKLKPQSTVTFEYWSKVNNAFHIAHNFKPSKFIIVFLSKNDRKPSFQTDVPSPWFLQFAKARNRGYLFYVFVEMNLEGVADAIFFRNATTHKMTIEEFEKKLKGKK